MKHLLLLLSYVLFVFGDYPVTVRQADSFVSTCCVNTHFNYGTYQAVSGALLQHLQKSGFRAVRDDTYPNNFTQMGVEQVWVTQVSSGMGKAQLQTQMDTLASRVNAGLKLHAIEGPNEPNGFWTKQGVTYNGLGAPNDSTGDPEGVLPLMKDLYSIVKANAALKNIPVWGPAYSQGGAASNVSYAPYVDYGNFHPYPTFNCYNGANAYDQIDNYFCQSNDPINTIATDYTYPYLLLKFGAMFPGKAMAQSETGYSMVPGSASLYVHTQYIPRIYVENFRMGVPTTCVYELFDQSSNINDGEGNYGMVFNNLTAKPALNVMTFVLNLLADRGESFTPDNITVSIAVTPVGTYTRTNYVHYIALQKRTKDFYIILWHEIALHDTSKQVDIMNIPEMPTTITLSTPMSSGTIHSFDAYGIVSNSTVQLSKNGTTFTTTALPSIRVIHLSPPAPPAATTGSKSTATTGHSATTGHQTSNSIPTFYWTSNGSVKGSCVHITDPSEPASHTWGDNYLCSTDESLAAWKWSSSGKISGMNCIQWLEASDPNGWNNNYLCIPLSDTRTYVFSSSGKVSGMTCTQTLETSDPNTWTDNYWCVAPAGTSYLAPGNNTDSQSADYEVSINNSTTKQFSILLLVVLSITCYF